MLACACLLFGDRQLSLFAFICAIVGTRVHRHANSRGMQIYCKSALFPGLGLLPRVLLSQAYATLSHMHTHSSVAPCALADATGCGDAARMPHKSCSRSTGEPFRAQTCASAAARRMQCYLHLMGHLPERKLASGLAFSTILHPSTSIYLWLRNNCFGGCHPYTAFYAAEPLRLETLCRR